MLRLLIDENVNHRILRGLKLILTDVDYLIAQDVIPRGTEDADLLAWAAEQNRILVTNDLKTIPQFAYARVEAGEFMPGVIAFSKSLPIGQAIDELATIIVCSEQVEWENQVVQLPL